MKVVLQELEPDEESRHMFFKTIFEKMHLRLTNIRIDAFKMAE